MVETLKIQVQLYTHTHIAITSENTNCISNLIIQMMGASRYALIRFLAWNIERHHSIQNFLQLANFLIPSVSHNADETSLLSGSS